jgi:cytochrome c oxidase subunit II
LSEVGPRKIDSEINVSKRIWSGVTVLLLIAALVIFLRHRSPKPSDSLNVTVIGHQFWWEYRYPKLGIVTANELHIPVSDKNHPTPTYLTLSSADTDHRFWVSQLAAKVELTPNRASNMWLHPETPGIYVGQCVQPCGPQDAKMMVRIYADRPADFAAWVARQQQPAVDDPGAAEGRRIFQHTACISCHAVSGTIATGRFGPDLTHVASRDTIASGSLPNTTTNLRAFVDNPASLKPGSLMPAMRLDDHDLDAVTAYMITLK